MQFYFIHDPFALAIAVTCKKALKNYCKTLTALYKYKFYFLAKYAHVNNDNSDSGVVQRELKNSLVMENMRLIFRKVFL